MDRGLHDDIFSPVEDEEAIMLLAVETLGLMLWEETAVDQRKSGRATHMQVRRRKEGEPSFQAQLTAREREDAATQATEPTEANSEAMPDAVPASTPTANPDADAACASTSATEPVPEAATEKPATDAEQRVASEPTSAPAPLPAVASTSAAIPEPAPAPPPQAHLDTEWERELLDEIERLTTRTSEQEAKIASLTYHLSQLSDTLEQERAAASAELTRAEILETMEVPTSPAEALLLAERAFADRLIVMDCAHKSARAFVRGDTAEVWAILRSMAMVLHPMIFGRGGDNVVYAFKKQTGFELTLREMKMIKQVERLAKLRTVSYRGVEHSATAHVKGRGRGRGETLRVHFFADYDEQRLVIAHCGEHLTTFETTQL